MNRFVKFEKKDVELGPFIKSPHPEIIEACGLASFDFVVVDMEHTPLSPRDLYPLVLAAENRGIKLIVRIPKNDEEYFKWCLDLGVRYIQVPHIQSPSDAKKAIRNSFFGPGGSRGLCRFVRAADFSTKEKNDYLKDANSQTKLILQIEGSEGLAQIDDILKVDGIDTIFIGPYDLSQSLGKPGLIWDDAVISAMKKIISSCSKANVKVGTFTDNPEGVKFWINSGVKIVQYASDLHLFFSGVELLKKELIS